jgi:hypothetical protein
MARKIIKLLITIAERPSTEYKLAVVPIFEESSASYAAGNRGQETTCKSIRECRIYANGFAGGHLAAAGFDAGYLPVEIDPILIDDATADLVTYLKSRNKHLEEKLRETHS